MNSPKEPEPGPGHGLKDTLGHATGRSLRTATRKGAELLRADSLGALMPRKVADLVVLDANPAADIAATRRIAFVMIRGRIVYPDSLRRTWAR